MCHILIRFILSNFHLNSDNMAEQATYGARHTLAKKCTLRAGGGKTRATEAAARKLFVIDLNYDASRGRRPIVWCPFSDRTYAQITGIVHCFRTHESTIVHGQCKM